jgi:hypothetical protein
MADTFAPVAGPAVEAQLIRDMVRRGLPAAPILVLLASIPWGVDGALSALYGIAIVVGNLVLSAALLAGAARISLAFVMGAVLFGYLARLGIVLAAVLLVTDAAWVEIVPLGLTIIVTHLGLLLWETRYVSASLAFPGVRPSATTRSGS